MKFLHQSAYHLIRELKNKPKDYWIKRGENAALVLFKEMTARVPAYKDFLKQKGVNPRSVTTIDDFKKIPLTNKENYLKHYSTEELCWDGQFTEKQWMVSSTSGSTGEPYYFPRSLMQDKQFSKTAEMCLLDYYDIKNKSTLFIDCYALGIWIGGMFMYQSIKHLQELGKYKITLATPGANKVEALKLIKSLAKKFDQIIIAGYGPLVKDLIDDGISIGIQWNEYDVKYFFAAEGFTEGFRDYLKYKGGLKDIFLGAINHFGTADLGTMSHETPLSILIRRLALENDSLYKDIFFEGHKLPTLTQYIPELFFFEEVDHKLVCSSRGGLPLLRYDLKDLGGVIKLNEMLTILNSKGFDVTEEIKKRKIDLNYWKLPFVYVGERADFTVSIYSVNIYPESIRKALENVNLRDSLTGKFSMIVDFDTHQNQYLEINVEMKKGVNENKKLHNQIIQNVIHSLNKENSEWSDFYADAGIRDKVIPRIAFWEYQHPKHFKIGGKQKWVKK